MGFEDEMYEYQDDLQQRKMDEPFILFKEKNLIYCKNISFWKVMWIYFFWVLNGKPNNWSIYGK